MIANVFTGKGEPNGSDEREVSRSGLDLRRDRRLDEVPGDGAV